MLHEGRGTGVDESRREEIAVFLKERFEEPHDADVKVGIHMVLCTPTKREKIPRR